jgi:hypothetical protein
LIFVFEAAINGIFSFSFQSVHCWCTERLLIFVSWFCILLLLLKLFMGSKSFWVEFFRSFRYNSMSSANRDSLATSLLIFIPFILLSALLL